MAIQINDKTACSGCTACMAVCAHHAISMQTDELGFSYPVVDPAACTECGLCERICPFHDGYCRYDNLDAPKVYAVRVKDDAALAKSQSGGAFTLLSDEVLRQEGTVYGAVYDDHFCIRHVAAHCSGERDQQRGSKYVQSDLGNTIRSIKEELKQGHEVMFTGTPCQVVGLRSFVGKRLSERLYTVDLMCYGVCAPKVWSEYLEFLQRRHHKKILIANMRDKADGWRGTRETYVMEDGTKVKDTSFLRMYFANFILRPSCTACPFGNSRRVGDITIGDFWAIELLTHKYDDNKGVSLVLLNSQKGIELFKEVSAAAEVLESDVTTAFNSQKTSSPAFNPRRDEFVDTFVSKGFAVAYNKYVKESLRTKMIQQVLRLKHAVNVKIIQRL